MNYLDSALALFAVLVWCLSAWGWGRLVLDFCGIESAGRSAYHVMLGLAVLAGAGGWLNFLGIAYPPTLWALLVAGWIAALRRISPARLWKQPLNLTGAIETLPAVAAGLAAVFLVFTLLPSAVFNPMDDLQLYFHRPVQMLQAGTLGGDPFNYTGFDSLGIHAFLQAFTLLAFSARFLNAFDAVLCAVLAMMLVADAGRTLKVHSLVAAAAMASLALLPPWQGNISSTYAIAALVLALLPAAFTLLQHGVPSGQALWRRALPPGLLVAAIIGLKSTTLSFALPAALVFLALIAYQENPRAALRAAGTIGAWTMVFLLPWIGLHAPNYGRWFAGGPDSDAIGYGGNPSALLTNMGLTWGGPFGAFNIAAGIILAAALAGTTFGLSRVNQIGPHRLIPILALCWGAIAAYLLNTIPYDLSNGVRYSTPALMVGIAIAALLAGSLIARGAGTMVVLAIPIVIALTFAAANSNRFHSNLAFRSTMPLSEGVMRNFERYTDWALSADAVLWVRNAQARIPPGERILAFIALPHHLFFARNPVLVASEPGLAMPWLRLPLDADAEGIRRFLQQHGVRYVIWQIGNGTKPDEQLQEQLEGTYPLERRMARGVLSLRKSLAELTKVSELLHEDDGLFVIRIVDR